MEFSAADRTSLLRQLDRLSTSVEELLLTGLTTASEATRQMLGVTFQEASRLKLLRLSGTLRVANEELGRYTGDHPDFSQARLAFFLNRAWLLGRQIADAVRNDDKAKLENLMAVPRVRRIKQLKVVTLGVVKKLSPGAFCAFEFRLRGCDDGRAYVWSTVFPLKSGAEIPPEGFLHIPQKQKFTASLFLDRHIVTLRDIGVAGDATEIGRIHFSDASIVEAGKPFEDWDACMTWSPDAALERLRTHEPGPFDLDVELQEEIVFDEWSIGEPRESENDRSIRYPLRHENVEFEARVSSGIDGRAAIKSLNEIGRQRQRPPLYGLMHYEACRLVVQPLSVYTDEGPQYITISEESIDRKALLKTLKFT